MLRVKGWESQKGEVVVVEEGDLAATAMQGPRTKGERCLQRERCFLNKRCFQRERDVFKDLIVSP